MGMQFNADEIFEMAEQIERNGAKFYRRAAEGTRQEAARKTLAGLATWEEQHLKTFGAMRAELSSQERKAVTFDPYDEGALYLKAMADGRVFDTKADPAAKLTGKETLPQILQTAIGLEKDSIAFYLGLREMVPEKLGKDRIDKIIKEEMGHIATLSKQMTP